MFMDLLGKILIVDDNRDVLFALNLLLADRAAAVRVCQTPERVPHFMQTFAPDVVLLDMNFRRDTISGEEGFDTLKTILDADPAATVVMMTAYADTDKAVRAIKMGATDFVSKPWKNEKLLATLAAAYRLRQSQRETENLKAKVETLSAPDRKEAPTVIGRSPAMMSVLALVDKLAQTDANILLSGENGTGKDVIARLLAQNSPRAGAPFVSIDVGCVPENLFEGELFGYEKGAFTDARRAKAGRMEVASGGTLLLDEIGNLSLPMQAKLLTAIERREITRIGATQPVSIDIRLICATNADLPTLVEAGRFRQDLLYRINTVELRIPPLRERGDDIHLLASYFLERFSRKYGKDIRSVSREAKEKLARYSWPGNVRELEHAIERAVILCEGRSLGPEHFALHPQAPTKEEQRTLNLSQLEREAIERAVKLSGGNLTRAAEALGISRFALYRKMEKLGL